MKNTKDWNGLSYRDKLSYILCISAFGMSAILIMAAMIIPPPGEVHSSVLGIIAMLLAFVGSILGISQHYSTELSKFKNEIVGAKQMANDKIEETEEYIENE